MKCVVIALLAVAAGCRCVDCSKSGSAGFPTVERWWK